MGFKMSDCNAVEVIPFRNGNEYDESYKCGWTDGSSCDYKICKEIEGMKAKVLYKGKEYIGTVFRCTNGYGFYNVIDLDEWQDEVGMRFIPDKWLEII